ncbi:hypothetical protein P7K49_001094, partial [Saguinus oedipus]
MRRRCGSSPAAKLIKSIESQDSKVQGQGLSLDSAQPRNESPSRTASGHWHVYLCIANKTKDYTLIPYRTVSLSGSKVKKLPKKVHNLESHATHLTQVKTSVHEIVPDTVKHSCTHMEQCTIQQAFSGLSLWSWDQESNPIGSTGVM